MAKKLIVVLEIDLEQIIEEETKLQAAVEAVLKAPLEIDTGLYYEWHENLRFTTG